MPLTGPFLVPQFIDVESKIFGPITTRQFLIMMVAAMLDFLFYKMFFANTAIIVIVINSGIFMIVAFLKINGMPFHYFFVNLMQTLLRSSIRVWQRMEVTTLPPVEKTEVKKEFVPKAVIPESRLSSLSLTINTGGAYKEED
ncbi:MAG: PrgI family protein [Candidatus Parcubacteria bacterium]|nr:PrgI family protein [Candidatus Parcubacteria bacterium]